MLKSDEIQRARYIVLPVLTCSEYLIAPLRMYVQYVPYMQTYSYADTPGQIRIAYNSILFLTYTTRMYET